MWITRLPPRPMLACNREICLCAGPPWRVRRPGGSHKAHLIPMSIPLPTQARKETTLGSD
jgi:hypothetical protein